MDELWIWYSRFWDGVLVERPFCVLSRNGALRWTKNYEKLVFSAYRYIFLLRILNAISSDVTQPARIHLWPMVKWNIMAVNVVPIGTKTSGHNAETKVMIPSGPHSLIFTLTIQNSRRWGLPWFLEPRCPWAIFPQQISFHIDEKMNGVRTNELGWEITREEEKRVDSRRWQKNPEL